MITKTKVEEIDSAYFAEEDVMSIQADLLKQGYINPDPEDDNNFELTDPVFLAKALDRLVDNLIAGILEYPEDMLFSTCDGSHGWEFARAIKAVKASGMTKEELKRMK